MDVRQLRYFLQIVESGSFSAAADLLHVAQPSLSQHVRSLEEELGVSLLTRHARGVAPTELGLLLRDHARAVLQEIERTKEALRLAADSPGGEVKVGLPTSACRGLTIPLIEAAAQRYPRISIHLVEAMTGSLDEWVQLGRLDVALLYDHQAVADTVVNEVMIEDLMLILPADHPSAAMPFIEFADLFRFRLALPSRPHVIRGVVEQAAARAGLPVDVAINCDSLPAIVQLVRNGCATLFSSFAMSEEIGRGELAAVAVRNPSPNWRISIVQSRKSSNPRSGGAIARLMEEVVSSLVRSGKWKAQIKPVR